MTFRTALSLATFALLAACRPDPAVVHRMAGDELLGKSDFAGAAAEYAQSVALAPAQPPVWEKLAFAKLKAGDRDGAAETLARRAELETDPARKVDAYRNAAGIYLQGPDRDKAERYLLELVRLDPADEGSLNWLGELASTRGGARMQSGPVVPAELDQAIGYYGRVIALRPDGTAAHANRRIVLVKYLAALEDERAAQTARLKRAGRDAAAAADARERIARADAKRAELEKLLAESNAKLAPARKGPPSTTAAAAR
jgi:tetratricopeptide (TPR) repeat protein